MQGLRIELGGTAKVYCVHDREKRVVMTERQVAELGRNVGQLYDARQHKIHRCACCENLFVDCGDTPRYCLACQRVNIHTIMGPLAKPVGVVDG